MDEQREQPNDERPEAAGEVDEAELEQAAGGHGSLPTGAVTLGHQRLVGNDFGDMLT